MPPIEWQNETTIIVESYSELIVLLDGGYHYSYVPPVYRSVPEENKNPIAWVNPQPLLNWQLDRILQWGTIIDLMIAHYDYPEEYRMLAFGIIAAETQGDHKNVGCDFNNLGQACGIGVMAVVPRSWTQTARNLMNPRINISVGLWMFDSTMKQAVDKYNYKPGREATRAALGGYNCGFKSLVADRCYSFGGFTYSDKVLNYWLPLLETRLQELQNEQVQTEEFLARLFDCAYDSYR